MYSYDNHWRTGMAFLLSSLSQSSSFLFPSVCCVWPNWGGEGEGPFLCVPTSTNGFWICSYSPLPYLGPPFLAFCVSPLFFSAFYCSSVLMYLLILDPLATTRKYVCTHFCRFLVVLQCSPIGEKFPPTIVWHILYTKMKNLKILKLFGSKALKHLSKPFAKSRF